jgi:DNA repair and recombination protein RAD52
MFTDQQKAELAKPLSTAHVAQREQAGRKFSYIEGWHAIAEANRIFGFDAWARETIELRQLGEPRDVGGKARVDYLARVRIRVGDIVRDGCGFGQGIDKDVGQAHESALKEAETDAMKRALMTFGNPFGLALYDKSHSNVEAPAQAQPAPVFITDAQRDTIATLAEAAGVTLLTICEGYKIQSLKELPAGKYAALVKRLQTNGATAPQQKAA